MANRHSRRLLKKGAGAWNSWKTLHPWLSPNLSGADLHAMDLCNIDFSETNLYRATLGKTVLRAANLYRANLGGADLCEAVLACARMVRADLPGRA